MSTQPQAETMNFQAEVKQLLYLVTHALYSNKEIFLRELISNASDAADKLRYEALSDAALYENDPDLKIWIDFDAKQRTITIRDNGIGMNREEVVQNLGTIAKSGTREFLSALTGDKAKDMNLIGQFGVGFYSAFVVADKVIVKTRRAGMNKDQGVYWESTGQGEYSIKNIEKAERGTEIILELKKEEDEFLDQNRLRHIITKYSDHILLPIVMKKTIEGENKETKIEEEVVNRANALWAMPKSQIKDDEYKELYKHISHDFQDPLTWAHNKVEGKQEYISLLYIPEHAPFDLWNRDRQHGLKLYVKRVFIMDDAEQLLPNYLRFVRGVVDSNDLPLNISREILQHNKVIEGIRSGVIKRILGMLETLAKDDKEKYAKFWKEFGSVLKEGPAEDHANREAIAKLLRFASTHSDSSEQTTTLDDYINRMQAGQDKIYYITAETFTAAKNSPHLEIFRKKGLEVLLLTDRIDEWLVTHMTEYAGKNLQSVAKGDLEIEKPQDAAEEKKEKEKVDELASVVKRMQEILTEKVKEVRVSHRLTDSPACLVTDANDMSFHLQRILQASGQNIPAQKPIMEINPDHLLIKKLKDESDEDRFAEWSRILFDQSLLAEGGKLEDPAGFVKRLNNLIMQLSS
jgi:molecular chaperone HtpG